MSASHGRIKGGIPRPALYAPNGTGYYGRYPAQMGSRGEAPYIAELARQVNGICEVVLPVGRADCANATTVFEVEPVTGWRGGTRQALAYAGQTGWKPALALFGQADYLRIYLFLRDRVPGVTLWIWRGWWDRTTNRNDAQRKGGLDIPLKPQVSA